MAAIAERRSGSARVMWLTVALAVLAAASYVLMGQHVLETGLNVDTEGGAIVYVAAGGYLLGGILILLQRRWLWITGLAINTLVLFFFFSMYSGNPTVLLSPGGLTSKASQVLLEMGLVYLIIAGRPNSRRRAQ
jgi:hypothetical protein